MNKKIVICLIAVLALSLMGFGFAKWSDSVSITAAAQSGKVDWGFTSYSTMQKDQGPDWTCDPGMDADTVRPAPEEKDVGKTTLTLRSDDGDGRLDTLDVEVKNAYPCYYNEISAKVKNYGTIPVIVQKPVLTWIGTEGMLEQGKVYYLCIGGNGEGRIELAAGSPPGDAVIEIRWMDNAGFQHHPGDIALEESFELHVLQPAEQNHNYKFSITVEAVQWNESPIPAINPQPKSES